MKLQLPRLFGGGFLKRLALCLHPTWSGCGWTSFESESKGVFPLTQTRASPCLGPLSPSSVGFGEPPGIVAAPAFASDLEATSDLEA